jgi:hypothetical protein
MARRIPGWVKFCGIGCGAMILIAVGMLVGSFFFFRDAIQDFGAADRSAEDVLERYGAISEFRPDRAGAIPRERIEAFLAARDAVEPARFEADRSLATLSADPERGGAFRKLWAATRVLHQLAGFHQQRNEALIEAEMGLGEYYYIYTLAYYSWLGKSPADGPSFQLVGDNGYVLQDAFQDLGESEVREIRADTARRSLNRLLLPVLRGQLSDPSGNVDPDDGRRWKEALELEIAALEADDHRIPWEDGLPEIIESSLLLYRDRFERSYSPMCNALEIGVARR